MTHRALSSATLTLSSVIGVSLLSPLFLAAPGAQAKTLAETHSEPDEMSLIVPEVLQHVSSYQAITPQQAVENQPLWEPGGAALPIFLNRWGGTYTSGWNNSATNQSSIVNGGSATVGGFPGTDAQWAEHLECVQEQFAAFNVVVTDIEPQNGEYIEAVVGGSPQQLGLPNGVGGVAPIDPYDCQIIDRAIVYAFADVYIGGGWGGGLRSLCETTTQEVAHALSLDHAYNCSDPMTYLNGCGDKWFQDEWVDCGEYEARQCNCNLPSQNSVQILLEKLGPSDGTEPPPPVDDNELPVVDYVAPANGSTFLPNSEINITANVTDDVGLTQVQLYWENNDIWLGCPGSGGGWSCEKIGDQHTWTLSPSEGARTFFVSARDVVGNTTESAQVTVFFTEDGEPPPLDITPPTVSIVDPADGAELQNNSAITVTATASDDEALSAVELNWEWSGDTFACPLDAGAVTCEIDGNDFVWTLNVGEGSRTFSVTATDQSGNETTTSSRTIQLVDDPAEPPANDAYEDNDTWEQGTLIGCGDVLDLIAESGDEDWFRLSVPLGQGLRLSASGEVAADLSITVNGGPNMGSVMAEGSGTELVELVPEGGELGVRVVPAAGVYGAYQLDVSCVPADQIGPIDPGDNPGDGDGDTEPGDGDGNGDKPPTGDGDGNGDGNGTGDGDGTGDANTDGDGTGDGDGTPGPVVESGCSASGVTSTSAPYGLGFVAILGLTLAGRRRRRTS